MIHDKPRGARYWAREWRVHHNTARKLLAHIHRHYGSKAVWRVGPQRALVATTASLQVVRVLRAERNLIVVLGAGRAPQSAPTSVPTPLTQVRRSLVEDDGQEYVTVEHHGRAIAEIWSAVQKLGGRRPNG